MTGQSTMADSTKAAILVGGAAALAFLLHKYQQQQQVGAPATAEKATREIRAVVPAAEANGAAKEHSSHPQVDVRACQSFAVDKYMTDIKTSLKDAVSAGDSNIIGELSKYIAFKDAYGTKFAARPDVDEGVLLRITDWKLLTPKDYDRTCFHFEVDISGTNIEHLCNGSDGKALSVYATNDVAKVKDFIQKMGLNSTQIVSAEDVAPPEDESVVLTTVEKMFTQYLDLFGKPTREFLKKLVPYAVDIQDKVKIAEFTLDRKTKEFQNRQALAYTFADYILEFKSLKIPVDKYFDLLPTIKQRVYSICSSTDYRPGKCQLLVVQEDWQAKDGSTKFGLCSTFLATVASGNYCVGHSTHSVMQLPADTTVPIFMAGLGTGLAPFRAFVEQRKYQKNKGQSVGPMTLFFGGRHEHAEYYYKDEFEAYQAEGLVKCCNAWSRDQAKKVYVQHKITEEADSIWEHLGKPNSRGAFFLCGSKQPEKDVFAAIIAILKDKGNMSDFQAQKKMEELQSQGRYVTEVY